MISESTIILRISFSISLVEILLVGVDEKAGEGAVRPVGVKEEPVLVRVEDLQPHLVGLLQVEHGGTRRHVVVPRVTVERPDLVLAVVHQPDGQVFVGQSDVVCEIVDAGDGADELAAAGVVVIALVQQNPAEADGQPLLRVALGRRHREGRSGPAATVAPPWSSLRADGTQFSSTSSWSRRPCCPPRSL